MHGRRKRVGVTVKFFSGPLQPGQTGKKESEETKQRASEAAWPLAAHAINTTNH